MYEQDFVVPVENRLLLTRCDYDRFDSDPPCMTLELYDTTLRGDAWDRRCVLELPEGISPYPPKVLPKSFCPCISKSFHRRPEDRILLINTWGERAIVVSVSTLLHFSKPGRFVTWDEWKKYTWIADLRQTNILNRSRIFFSGSGFMRYGPHPKDQLLRVTVTSFLPSIEEKPSPTIGSAHDGEHMPILMTARERERLISMLGRG